MRESNPVTAMVIEDEPVTRAVTKAVLEHLGCVVVGESDIGEAALDLYRRTIPDLTVLDIDLPGQSGLDTLTALRRENPDAYVVMLSGVMDADTIEDCARAGAKDFLMKSRVWETIGPRLQRHVDRLGGAKWNDGPRLSRALLPDGESVIRPPVRNSKCSATMEPAGAERGPYPMSARTTGGDDDMANVLVIDDDAIIRDLLREILTAAGHGFAEAADGDAGIKAARAGKPDIIVMDMRMPKMTGLELAPLLRSHPDTRGIPIIALTGDTSTEAIEQVHMAGCDRYLTKPVKGQALLRFIDELLAA